MRTMDLKIVWEEPPPRGGHACIAQQLRDNPGQWARIETPYRPKSGKSVAYRINGGGLGYGPAGDFEATWRTEGDITHVYVRYLGDGGSDE